MKTFFIALLSLMSILYVSAQKTHQPTLEHIDNDKMQKQIDSSMKELDSMNIRINEGYKSTMHTMDSLNNHLRQQQNERNLNEFMSMQKENEARANKTMWMRIGLGVFFLAVLIFGMMRRKKKAI